MSKQARVVIWSSAHMCICVHICVYVCRSQRPPSMFLPSQLSCFLRFSHWNLERADLVGLAALWAAEIDKPASPALGLQRHTASLGFMCMPGIALRSSCLLGKRFIYSATSSAPLVNFKKKNLLYKRVWKTVHMCAHMHTWSPTTISWSLVDKKEDVGNGKRKTKMQTQDRSQS